MKAVRLGSYSIRSTVAGHRICALEINDPVEAFRPATAATCRDPSGVVPAALLGQTLGEGS
jgi:hypothetical protein